MFNKDWGGWYGFTGRRMIFLVGKLCNALVPEI